MPASPSNSDLQRMLGDIRSDVSVVKQEVKGIRELRDEQDRNILATLKRIEEQTVKTNGRVTMLERQEDKNSLARKSLIAVAVVILLAFLNAILKGVTL